MRRDFRAFSLLETMVALGLISVILFVLAGLTRDYARASNNMEKSQVQAICQGALKAVERDVLGASRLVVLPRAFPPQPGPVLPLSRSASEPPDVSPTRLIRPPIRGLASKVHISPPSHSNWHRRTSIALRRSVEPLKQRGWPKRSKDSRSNWNPADSWSVESRFKNAEGSFHYSSAFFYPKGFSFENPQLEQTRLSFSSLSAHQQHSSRPWPGISHHQS